MPDECTVSSGTTNRPGVLLALLGHEAMRRLREAHTAHAISPRQFQMLSLLRDGGPLPQRALTVAMGTAPSVLVTLLNPLEEAGLIERRRDPEDRRRHVVSLTDEGVDRLHAAASAQQEVENEFFRVLTGAQRQALAEVLTVLRDDLTGGDPHCATPASLDPDR